MNREETLALYERAQKEGKDAWNKWANEMLEERKRLEESGEWEATKNFLGELEPVNEITKIWFEKAEANFSSKGAPHTFEQDANFSNLIFPGETSFHSATFNGEASFHTATFKERAWFDTATFKQASFNTTAFKERASFNTATFKERAWFDTATFNGIASFNTATFKERASFHTATFNGIASFHTATFKERAWFDTATFNGEARFNTATFNEAASFNTATFNGEAWFDTATFKEAASFNTATFKERASFDTATFKQASFITATFNGYTTFHNAKFEREANFNAIRSESAFTLEGTQFKSDVPNFIQAHFEESPRLDHINLGRKVQPGSFLRSILCPVKADIKARYQALKRLAIQAHDHENEQLFWAGELRSDRSLKLLDKYEDETGELVEKEKWNLRPLVSAFWWGNIAYGCVSDYGRSIVRPLGTLLILVILMTSLHLSVSKESLSYENTFSAGYISANKSIFNLGADPTKRNILKEKYSALYGANENQTPNIPKTILIAEIGQTLLSAILIFLALLGIRNNFKLK